MKALHRWWLVAILAALAGCPSLPAPESFDQRLAYAYGVYTAVVNTAAAGVETGALSVDEGQSLLELSDQARILLDAARVVEGARGEDQLTLALAVLTEAQAYLNRRAQR